MIVTQTNWRRNNKQTARENAVSNLDYIPKCSIWMPGNEALCVNYALQQGVLDANSKVILVERDRDTLIKMNRHLLVSPLNTIFHNNDLEELELPNKTKIDFSFLDFCGSMSPYTLQWLRYELMEHWICDPKNRLSITHSFGWRNNQFLSGVQELFNTEYRNHLKEFGTQLGYRDFNLVIPLVLFKCAFNNFNFEIRSPYKYQDSRRSMILFRFENFQKLVSGTNGWPDITTILTAINSKRKLKMSSKSANKAWATRRKNSMAKKPTPNQADERDDTITRKVVIDAYKNAKNPAQVAHATRKRMKYVAACEKEGKNPERVTASIMASVQRAKAV
mgnify:FL=1